MFKRQVKKLGTALSDAFTMRARHYFSEASRSDGQTKINQQLMGAMLAEVASVILIVTSDEKNVAEDVSQ